MRARDIMLFVICVSVAAPIVITMGVFFGGPAGVNNAILNETYVGLAIGVMAAGGASVLLFNVRVPAVLGVYGVMYTASISMMTTLIIQMVEPFVLGEIVAGIFVVIAGIIGILGAMEISSGPHGPMA